MVGLHVQHRADVDFGDAHAGAQQAAARGLEHGGVDVRIGEHHARRHGAGHVARDRALAVDVDAVGRREARRVAGHLEDVREHARRRRLAVGAGDRGDRHARGRAGREQHVDHGPGRVARRALGGRDVHAEARRGVHLADAAADLLVRERDVLRQEIDAADVEADRLDGAHRHVAVVRVDDVGDVGRGAAGGEVRGRAQVHLAARFRHRVGRRAPARFSIISACASISRRVSTFSWPTPRRGSWFTISTSCATVCVAVAGRRGPACGASPRSARR